MNFLRNRINKQNSDPSNSRGERNRPAFISKLIVTGLASAGLFLAGCAEAKEAPQTPTATSSSETAPTPTPRETTPAPTTPEDFSKINTQALKNIQRQAHERWPGIDCAFAFYKGGQLNVDVTDAGLMAAIEEFAYQGNPALVPENLAGREPVGTYKLSQDQKEVIALSAQYIAEETGPISEPGGRIGVCEVPQGTVDKTENTYVILDRGPSKEVANK